MFLGNARRVACSILVFSFLVLLPAVGQEVRRPRGIYAVVDIDGYIDSHGGLKTSALRDGLKDLYSNLLGNQAVSGLAIQMGWHRLNSDPSTAPDWTYLDDVFKSVADWNSENVALAPKTVQISLFPGLFSPQWLLASLPTCDGLFDPSYPTATTACGTVTFKGFFEPHEGDVLPLPWNPVYQSAYKAFLRAFSAHFSPKPEFVSMDVGGPTTASTEMILPHNGNTPKQFGGTVEPDLMWKELLQLFYPGQPPSDQPIIDAWNSAIDEFGAIFSDLTLVAYTGDGLLNFVGSFTIPPAFVSDCPLANMDCGAEATILTHFIDPTVGGNNAKATGEEGMSGFEPGFPINLGLQTAKRLAASTALDSSPSAQILGGQQFGTGFSTGGIRFGCTKAFPPGPADLPAGCVPPTAPTKPGGWPVGCIPQACLAPGATAAELVGLGYTTFGEVEAKASQYLIAPEQDLFNILANYFNGTIYASLYGRKNGAAPENYLQIYASDFQYANSHANEPGLVVVPGGIPVPMFAQDMLNKASQQLLAIAEPTPVIVYVKDAEGDFFIGPGLEAIITGTDLAPVGFDSADGTGPTSLRGVSVTVNGTNASILRTSPTEVRIITPADTPISGLVPVVLTTDGSTSAPVIVQCATRPIPPEKDVRHPRDGNH